MSEIIYLPAPPNFDFRRTVHSHGWYQLPPFHFDEQTSCLKYVFNGAEFEFPLVADISETNGIIRIEIAADKINFKQSEKIARDVRRILRFDDDLREFYKLVANEKPMAWIVAENAGRLLRSPTVWEDLVKTVCTTNCSWALTEKMTANLVEKLGAPTSGGQRAFPTAEQMAGASVDFYKTEIRAGYRSAYFAELAENAARGAINPESWLDSDLPTAELKKEMKRVKGVGDYAAENLLKLVGRFDGLALDSWLRAQFYKKHNGGQLCEDQQIRRHYERFGDWRGLAIWCDLSER